MFKRDHTCTELTIEDVNKEVNLCGWVNKRRDHGSMIFIDLRDRYGLCQLVFDPDISSDAQEIAKQLRNEWVIYAKGIVSKRNPGMENKKMETGEIEIKVNFISILSKSKPTPFPIFDDQTTTSEELRLKYRYLDLRRKEIMEKIEMRSKSMLTIRNFLNEHNFLEVNTPILCKSTPEGARDYLVPSRIYPGNYYALPQSPQIFKQLLMIGGTDRYFQLAQCFRDEDLRADRQPEFTQIDIEMSFAKKEDIFNLCENMLKDLFKKCLDVDIQTPFKKLSYDEAMDKYGSDKPDLRYNMEFLDLKDLIKNSTFSVFLDAIKNNNSIKGFIIENGQDLSRKKLDKYEEFAKNFNLKGLSNIRLTNESIKSNISKFFTQKQLEDLTKSLKMKENDVLLIACDKKEIVNQALDHLRRKVAKDRNLIKEKDYKFLWIVDFPLFEKDENENRLKSCHHPFTSPHFDEMDKLDTDPINVKAEAYDLVLNGYEIAGGSQRIHDSKVQNKIFELLNLSKEDISKKFGFFIDALSYGTPPHLGIAFGFDRLNMILSNTDNIRDVIAFPKTLKALDLMMQSPSLVSDDQLKELSISSIENKEITWE
ncbi:MAG: Aspartate--tRNA(Asp/Asn) ligase [Candidatus Anoxychlamydiales bacterium]|nr:Aspartate--tRNA(Asp/Asn) ligase [Candidatus Anoxychlamydiales bacterium]